MTPGLGRGDPSRGRNFGPRRAGRCRDPADARPAWLPRDDMLDTRRRLLPDRGRATKRAPCVHFFYPGNTLTNATCNGPCPVPGLAQAAVRPASGRPRRRAVRPAAPRHRQRVRPPPGCAVGAVPSSAASENPRQIARAALRPLRPALSHARPGTQCGTAPPVPLRTAGIAPGRPVAAARPWPPRWRDCVPLWRPRTPRG